MLITNKEDLLQKLKLIVSKDNIYLTTDQHNLHIYSYSDFYYLESISQQTLNNLIQDIVTIDINSEDYKTFKKYLSLKSSRLEYKDGYILMCKVKQNKNDSIPIIIDNSEVWLTTNKVNELPYNFTYIFNYENIDNYEDVCIFPNKVDTKFEFDSYKISDSIYINSKVLPIIHKVFSDSYVDIEYNLENNICKLSNNDAGNYLYIKCLDRIS